jgi:hypothetical protein
VCLNFSFPKKKRPFIIIYKEMVDITLIKSYLAGNKQELFTYAIYADAFLCFPLLICSFVVASTANAGFNCVLTAFLNIAFAAGAYFVIKKSKSPIAVSS